ncbi:MAG: MMPL family transporter, partial [Chloroflexi bacterium]|nr:MMPL family transporter [Chloroflexota bacterium]
IRTYRNSHISSSDMDVYTTGNAAISYDMAEMLTESIDTTTIVTIILVVVLLFIIYRSPVAILLPLLTIGCAYLVSRGALGIIGEFTNVWSQLDVLVIVLVFGVGTDYCLFIISRFREELGKTPDAFQALKNMLSRIGAVISASALAVFVGLFAMIVASFQMIKTSGPSLSVSIAVTLVAALTLTPAILSFLKRNTFWPAKVKAVAKEQYIDSSKRNNFWGKIGTIGTKYNILVIIVLVALLALPVGVLYPHMKISYDTLEQLPSTSESGKGFAILGEHFSIAEIMPSYAVIISQEGMMNTPQALAEIQKLVEDLHNVKGIDSVQSIITPSGNGEVNVILYVSSQMSVWAQGLDYSRGDGPTDSTIPLSLIGGLMALSNYLNEVKQAFPNTDISALRTALDNVLSEAMHIYSLSQINNYMLYSAQNIMQAANIIKQTWLQSDQISLDTVSDLLAFSQNLSNDITQIASYYENYYASVQYQSTKNAIDLLVAYISDLYGGLTLSNEQINLMVNLVYSQASLSADALQSSTILFNDEQFVNLPNVSTDSLNNVLGILKLALYERAQYFAQNDNPMMLSQVLAQVNDNYAALLNAFVSLGGDAMQIYILPADYPYSKAGMQSIADARVIVTDYAASSSIAKQAAVGGSTASMVDVQAAMEQDILFIQIVVVACLFVILAILLKSLIAPIYLMITVLLSYFATMGLCSWIFVDLLGHSGVSFFVPVVVFVLLVALCSDYNIFLMSRVREETENKPMKPAVRGAVAMTGGIISACGLILGGTFLALTISPILMLVQIGLAVAIGIFMDTLIMRPLLVPAITSLLGRFAWWPFNNKKTIDE